MRTVAVLLEARIAGFKQKMAEAGKAAADVGKSAKGVGKAAQREFEVLQDTAVKNEQSWRTVQNTIGAVGAAAGVVGGLAVREFSKFDQAMSGVASTGDDAKQSIEQLRDAAIQTGADTAFSAVEAANGVEELARAGVSAADILAGGLVGSLDLAAAGQIGVADAAGVAATAMTQFKLSGDQIPHLADLLAAGAGKAMGGVDELGQALAQSGLVASQFGLDIEETVGGLSAFAAAGLLGSDAGTSFKNMLLKLAKPSKQSQEIMDELGISAYDAQGQFVGLEGLAGQLQDRMSGLTDAQRQAALATIFGTDAIRAASVLYENGADGIAQWTEAVDDAGYAAETAAELQNNLVGDLEKLGGSWSTLAIEMGGVADGPLRTIVQGLTGLIDIAAETPGAAQSIMIAVTALAGLGLGAAALMKGVSAFAQYQTAMGELATSAPGIGRAATAVGKLGKAAGLAGAAFVVLQGAAVLSAQWREAAPTADAYAAALERVSGAATGAAAADIEGLFAGVNDRTFFATDGLFMLNDAFQATADQSSNLGTALQLLDQYGGDTVGNFLNLNTAFNDATARMGEFDQALKAADPASSASGFQVLRDEAERLGWSLEDTLAVVPQYRDAVELMASQNGLAKLSTEELATLMAGGVVDGFSTAKTAVTDLGAAVEEQVPLADQLASAVQEEADAMTGIIDAANAARDAIQGLNDAQRDGANAFLSAEAASDAYIAKLQAMTQQIKDNGTSLDQTTEKGRSNRAALRDLASSARDVTDAMIANGSSVDVVNAKMSEQRAQFIQTVGQFGITGAAAEALADSYGLIPNYVETLVATPGAKLSKQEADDLNAALDGLPDQVKSDIITVANRSGYDEAMSLLNQADGRTATSTINIITNQIMNRQIRNLPAMGAPKMKAAGGPVYGPGTTTSDSIPAMLSNREWVIRAWAADKIGPERMAYMNATGQIPHFNTGGQVTPTGPALTGRYTTPAPAAGAMAGNHITYISVEGREAHALLADQIRHAGRIRYQTEGVHRG